MADCVTPPGPVPGPTELRVAEAIAAHARGWALVPLNGKIPIQLDFASAPPPDLDAVTAWARAGNVGLRTGDASGVLAVDLPAGADLGPLRLPHAPTVETGSGALHLYFRAPSPCPPNTSSRLAPGVNTYGEGGQVVYVGSIHPVTGAVYRWGPGLSPDDLELPELPAGALSLITGRPVRAGGREPEADRVPMHDRDLERALLGAVLIAGAHVEPLRAATPHFFSQRNRKIGEVLVAMADTGATIDLLLLKDRLTSSGLLHECGGIGYLAELLEAPASLDSAPAYAERIRAMALRRNLSAQAGRLRDAAASGAPLREVSELAAGLGVTAAPALSSGLELGAELPEVLHPGAHRTAAGEDLEVGADDFVAAVLRALPRGVLYRRAGRVGELAGDPGSLRWVEITGNRLRSILDRHCRIVRWVKPRGEPVPVRVYVPCTRDLAGIVLDAAAVEPGHLSVRDLDLLVNYPVFVGSSVSLAEPGWNLCCGLFYDRPAELAGLSPIADLERCRALLDDLVVDFPFRDPADRDNFIGLLLTPLIRPAIVGNVPLHLIGSSLERTGKTKLAEQVLGGIVLGRRTPSMQLSGSDEERDKRIISMLLAGDTVRHIDNVREYLDSAALSSLLTGETYSGRLLSTNSMPDLPNRLTLVATGNNVRATGELVKRTIPIRLQPTTDAPEDRTDFEHPDLTAYVQEVRRDVLGALLGMVESWREQGRWAYPRPIGGFESWTRIVGGVLGLSGRTAWLANLRGWRKSADPHGEDLRAFVEAWNEKYGNAGVEASLLLELAEERGLFGAEIKGTTDRARQTSFSMRVLSRHLDTPVGGAIIRSTAARVRSYRLETEAL